MKKVTNYGKIPLSLAVWLCDDDYDHSDDPNTISATTLLKPMRAIVLARQNKNLNKIGDIEFLIPSRMGTALHTAIENTWSNPKKVSILLADLGYSPELIKNILINPEKEDISLNSICVYMEKRTSKKIGKFTITGKFDFVFDGALEDFKSTKVYGYLKGSNNLQYSRQGSIYRWLNPDIITNDIMSIQYIFTDWNMLESLKNPKYPTKRVAEKKLPLMSVSQTEIFVSKLVADITRLEPLTQNQLPVCTPEELWQKEDIFKYYKDPLKKTRSTKNFTVYGDALDRQMADGNIGVVDVFKGKVVRCKYCDVVGICDQAKQLIADGLLCI